MVAPSVWGLGLYLSCTRDTVARKAPLRCPCALSRWRPWEAPGCPARVPRALPCTRAGRPLPSVSWAAPGAAPRGGGPGVAAHATASGASSALSPCLQLCVQKLRILIEDSDQNRKAPPLVELCAFSPGGVGRGDSRLPGGFPAWLRALFLCSRVLLRSSSQ